MTPSRDWAGLLADHHPAKDVVRNLYRLSRVAKKPVSEPVPTTELDMAAQWWRSADGRRSWMTGRGSGFGSCETSLRLASQGLSSST